MTPRAGYFSKDRNVPVCPLLLAKNRGFPGHELNTIARLVAKHKPVLLEAWHEYFGA